MLEIKGEVPKGKREVKYNEQLYNKNMEKSEKTNNFLGKTWYKTWFKQKYKAWVYL